MRRYSRRALLGSLAAGSLASAALAGAVQPAAAAPAAPLRAVTVTPVYSADVLQAASTRKISATEAVKAYWTPARMRGARNADRLAGKAPAAAAATAKASAPRSVAPARPAAKAGVSAALVQPKVLGKVFYKDAAGGNWVCSASTVNSGSKRLISTAGHCLHSGRAGTPWYTNWVFVPQYHDGVAPYGKWAAASMTAYNHWTSGGRYQFDYGFVKAQDLNGVRIVNRVGGNGIQTGQSKSRAMTTMGYPSEAPHDGQSAWGCNGTSWYNPLSQPGMIQIACGMTRGASGGPWVHGFNESTGLGSLNGVNSLVSGDRDTWWSPYFDDNTWNLYNHANSLG